LGGYHASRNSLFRGRRRNPRRTGAQRMGTGCEDSRRSQELRVGMGSDTRALPERVRHRGMTDSKLKVWRVSPAFRSGQRPRLRRSMPDAPRGRSRKIAAIALDLASRAGSYPTGQTFVVDGGELVLGPTG